MKQATQPAVATVQPVKASPLSPAARKAWSVNFAAPQAMPSDRLKARAELVRTALSTGTY
jgi:hypothetical protein